MIPVLTAEDVRRQDAEAGEAGVERLMQSAGWAVARAASRMLGGTYGRRIVVVCGKGNNGGDGVVAARALAARGGVATVVLVFPRDDLNPLSSRQLASFGGRVTGVEELGRELARADLVIDGIFGVGSTRPPAGEVARAITMIAGARDEGVPVLSIDVPSGVSSDTGAVLDVAVAADATVSFGGYKPGLMFEPGRLHAGVVEPVDIGAGGRASAAALVAEDVAGLWPLRTSSSHKRSAGTVLVIAGSDAMPGAAALVCGASVHAGSGLTVLCAPEAVCRIAVARVPEITTIPSSPSPDGSIGPEALDVLGSRMSEFHAVAIGPGLSTSKPAGELVRALASEAGQPIVFDADALTALAGHLDIARARASWGSVMTPHAGELARLTGRTAAQLGEDRLDSARRVASDLGTTIVFKGPGTVIADEELAFVNPTGGGALAQGGTGDVLTGIVASVIAQRAATSPVSARALTLLTAAAVWVHGRAADRIAARVAPHPAAASMLIEEIGPTLHEVFA